MGPKARFVKIHFCQIQDGSCRNFVVKRR